MVKFPEAHQRLIEGQFVCKICKRKIKSSNLRVLAGNVRCRNCHSKALRPVRKK